jgi:hypothetical protein
MPQTGPTTLQLLEAVREFLQTELQIALEKSDPARAFHVRVAANALMIVERELQHGPAADAAELQRLRALLGQDGTLDQLNAELARALRAGERDETDPALLEHLERTVRDKIAIANPKWR